MTHKRGGGILSYYNKRETTFGVCLRCPPWELFSSGAETYCFKFYQGHMLLMPLGWTHLCQQGWLMLSIAIVHIIKCTYNFRDHWYYILPFTSGLLIQLGIHESVTCNYQLFTQYIYIKIIIDFNIQSSDQNKPQFKHFFQLKQRERKRYT